MANGYEDDPNNTSTTATPVFKPTMHLPPLLATAHLHRREDSFATPDTEEQDAHAFEIEKGFYKIQKSAQELLKLATTYQTHRSTTATASSNTAAAPRLSALPPEIDMLSMTQLSWGVLHAVNDINNHNQRLAARDQSSWLGGAVGRGGATPASCVAKRRGHKRRKYDGCAQCGVGDSPRWRPGPAGRSTLCNVCGLLYAKRVQGVKEDLRGG